MMRQFIKYTVEKKQQLMRQWDFFSKGILLTTWFFGHLGILSTEGFLGTPSLRLIWQLCHSATGSGVVRAIGSPRDGRGGREAQKQKQTHPSPKKVLSSIKHTEGSLGKL